MTFLKVIEKIDIIKKIHKYKIKSYLMSMIKNTYLNYLNKEKSMKATEKFIEALNEWDETTRKSQATDLTTLIFLISFRIGIKDDSFILEESTEERLNLLKERINYLVLNKKIDELFLILSLTNYVTSLLNHYIQQHGDTIVFHEEMFNRRPEAKPSKDMLEKLKSPNYLIILKNDYHRWKEIVSREFSEEKFEIWERESILESEEKIRHDLEKMKDTYGNMKMSEIIKNEL